ncbi:unannotated protein [freshwater metagenome]|uniref:Unannotated protein n=1 Tax=freshwater metagenome TaxID=449393 RepID=A0A6J7CHL5_9ZZZZ
MNDEPNPTIATTTTRAPNLRENRGEKAMTTAPIAASGTSTTAACTTSECRGRPNAVSKMAVSVSARMAPP